MCSVAQFRGLAGLSVRRARVALISLYLCFLILLGAAAARPSRASTLPADSFGLLPTGFLSARGSQIVGPDGTPVRIASVGLTGMNVVGGRLQLAGPFKGIEGHVAAMRAMGFNCVRVDWIDRTLDDPRAMAQLDAFVTACKQVGLKVIFDNHNNEATRADWENAAQQKNGLWFDTGPGTDGTDGPTDAAGAIADGDTLGRAAAAGLKPRLALDGNDAYPFFERLSDLIITGPTRTNVMDVRLVLVG